MRQLSHVAICAVMGILAGAASWFIYWMMLGAIFESGVHPDYWPDKLLIAVWVLATLTGLATGAIFIRTSSVRGGN